MYDFTRSTPRLAIRDATATDTKEPELSMKDLQDVPKTYSCDFTGPTPKLVVAGGSPTETNQLRLSTVDLRLPKYKAKLPVDTTSSALTPVSFENLAAIEAKLASVELELQRYSVGKTQEAIQQPQTPGRSSSAGKNVPTTESVDPADPEVMDVEMMTLNRTRVVFDKKTVTPWQMKMPGPKAFGHSPVAKKQNEPVDFHLSSVDLPPVRPRRHTATDRVPSRRKNSPRSNQEVDAEKRDKRLVPLRRKPDAEPIDFHLSTFDLKPRSRSSDAASPKSNQRETDQYQHYSKTKASSPVATDGPLKTPKYAKHDQCDLSYLDNFRSYTV
ncbi:hypothetical protein PHYBOEH_004817 [Phytophthora boehmeriae]|uniref:Uncharacterized protein n=1 Tax=Phytophthora boehmeriae TaxID=109152 RepID=A0A8T1WS17_9STRA|nr:hypothetical protein PHYBOEH_004817 [Phytophthora boehmeriae]